MNGGVAASVLSLARNVGTLATRPGRERVEQPGKDMVRPTLRFLTLRANRVHSPNFVVHPFCEVHAQNSAGNGLGPAMRPALQGEVSTPNSGL